MRMSTFVDRWVVCWRSLLLAGGLVVRSGISVGSLAEGKTAPRLAKPGYKRAISDGRFLGNGALLTHGRPGRSWCGEVSPRRATRPRTEVEIKDPNVLH